MNTPQGVVPEKEQAYQIVAHACGKVLADLEGHAAIQNALLRIRAELFKKPAEPETPPPAAQ